MSAYDNDPRVTPREGGGFDITVYPGRADSPTGRVEPWPGGEWGEWEATGRTRGGDDIRHFHPTADEAIRSLIGNPQ